MLIIKQKTTPNKYKNSNYTDLNKYIYPSNKHYSPAIQEWNDSTYNFNKKSTKLLPVTNTLIYCTMKAYFNMNAKEISSELFLANTLKHWFHKLSIIKLFISKPNIKHYNNKIIITICTFNRKKLYFMNKIKKFFKLFKTNLEYKLNSKSNKNNIIWKKKHFMDLLEKKKLYFITKFINKHNPNMLNKTTQNYDNHLVRILLNHRTLHNKFTSLFKQNTPKDLLLKNKDRFNNLRTLLIIKKKRNNILYDVFRNKSMSFFFRYIKNYRGKINLDTLWTNDKSHNLNKSLTLPAKISNKSIIITKKHINGLSNIFSLISQNTNYLTESVNNLYLEIKKNILKYKYISSMLYFNNYLFNIYNLLPLQNMLANIYSKKVEFKIINLKYLYLDSNIFAEAITTKLKDRKKRVLRVLKLGLKLTKKPHFKLHFHKDNIKLNYMFFDQSLKLNSSVLGPINNINNNKYLIDKPNKHKIRLFLYHMKQKIVTGVRLQGTGRLTKRLTASRSISKVKYMGSLKNINSSYENKSTIMLRGFAKSNLQYININNYNRNGSFGIKVAVSVH